MERLRLSTFDVDILSTVSIIKNTKKTGVVIRSLNKIILTEEAILDTRASQDYCRYGQISFHAHESVASHLVA